jgi:peptide deformylase
MIRPILRFGDPILHQPSDPVQEITPEIQTLIDDMIETMYAAPGIGLAAPQVGIGLRVFVADLSVGRNPQELITLVNPEIVECDGLQRADEGCLSVPGFSAVVSRPSRLVVRGLERDGTERVTEATELLARAFQHEIDHLEGRLFVDHLRGIKRELIMRRLRKLSRAGRW